MKVPECTHLAGRFDVSQPMIFLLLLTGCLRRVVRCVNQTTYKFLTSLPCLYLSFLIIVMYASTDLADFVDGNTLRLLNGHLLLLVPLSQRFQLLLVLLDHLDGFKNCIMSVLDLDFAIFKISCHGWLSSI